MATKNLEDTLLNEAKDLVKPDAAFKLVESDLKKIGPRFLENYTGGEVAESKLEDKTNEVAKVYINALYESAGRSKPLVDTPSLYGQMIREWSGKVSDDHYAKIRQAIKVGNAAKVLELISEAYAANAQSAKSTSHIAKVQSQSADTQLGLWKLTAKALGGDNFAKVAGNYPGALQYLGNLEATKAAYK